MTLPTDVLDLAASIAGSPVTRVTATPRGESKSTFRLSTREGDLLLKLVPSGLGVLENQQQLVRIATGLRRRGYPLPEYLGAAEAAGTVFTIQRWVSGEMLEPDFGRAPDPLLFRELLPDLLAAIELQRDHGDLAESAWPSWLMRTIEVGGDGYCVHATMRQRAETEEMLDRIRELARQHQSVDAQSRGDIVHFDLNPANILHDGDRLVAVVDWNVPFTGASHGDRGFDVATLLFYTYDLPDTREVLWDHAVAISGQSWAVVYLCHLVLRQVEWTLRHAPNTSQEQRFLTIARTVLDDCEHAGR